MQIRPALLWAIKQRGVAISYRRFGITDRSHLQGSEDLNNQCSESLKIGPISCTEKSVRNYYYPLRNSPSERSFYGLILFGFVKDIECVFCEEGMKLHIQFR